MTEFKIISAIKNYVTSQQGVTGFSLKNAQVGDEVDTLRMRLIDQLDRANRFTKPYPSFVQSITITVPDSKVLTIPKIYIREDGVPAVAYIGGVSASPTPFRVITGTAQADWIKHDAFIGNLPTLQLNGIEATFINFSSNTLKLIAVFEDPSSLDVYGYDLEKDEYPVPGKIQDEIIGKTAESYLRTMYRIPPQVNNQLDAPTPPQQK